MNATPILATPSRCPHLSARRPSSNRIAELASGIAMSSQKLDSTPVGSAKLTASANVCVTSALSVLQQVRVVDARGASSPEDRHDDRKPAHDLGGRHDHDEERHDLTVEGAVDTAERDECEVRGVEHQLDAHEQHDGVAADEYADGTDGEQHGSQNNVVASAHCSVPFGADSAEVSSRVGRIFEMLRSAGLPSGSTAGVATESDVANTPGPGFGAG